MHTLPPTATVAGAPIRWAEAPAKKAPNGAMPRNIMENRDMTRPRMSSGDSVCSSVFEAAVCSTVASPVTNSSASDSPSRRDSANRINDSPNTPAAVTTQRPSPLTSRRRASSSAPPSAPMPLDPMSRPSPLAPTPSTRSAKSGMRTAYGIPKRLMTPISVSSARMGPLAAANRKPPARWVSIDAGTGRARAGTWMRSSARMTATYDRPLRMKHHPSPTAATRTPATAGPSMRAAFTIDELSAIALGRSSRVTISMTNDCRVGMSNAFTTPRPAAIAMTAGTVTRWATVRLPSSSASTIAEVCVASSTRRRSTRSAAAPPSGLSSSTGSCPENPTRPSSSAERASRYTSQAWATDCSQVPTSEMSCPPTNRR